MKRLALAICMLAACGKSSSSSSSSERSGEPPVPHADFNGIVIDATGPAMAGKRWPVEDLTATIKANPPRGDSLNIALTPDASLPATLAAVEAVHAAGVREAAVMLFADQRAVELCRFQKTVADAPAPGDIEPVVMSVLVDAKHAWFSRSRIAEISQADLDRASIDKQLAAIKLEPIFAEEDHAELAIAEGVPTATWLPVLGAVCRVFPKLELRAPAKLTSAPSR